MAHPRRTLLVALLRRRAVFVCLAALLAFAGCTPLTEYVHNGFKVGPNYKTPPAPVAKDWIDANDVHVRKSDEELTDWWKVFNDPQMNKLVCAAYNQNLSLRQAGFQILQARAERAIAIGSLLPQQQQATGDYIRSAVSRETGKGGGTGQRFFSQWDFGFNLSWELDFWGRFRRAVEEANANLDASVANYDNVLITLVADVASTYVDMCTTQQRIHYAEQNIKLQKQLVDIVQVRPNTTTVDYQQALSTLRQTEALLPPLYTARREGGNRLCLLLGIPMEDLEKQLNLDRIPEAPREAVVGIPADLLRHRPDVLRAERLAAAQSAAIGIAEAEFYPHIALNGTLGYSAAEFKNLFRSDAFNGTFGPSFRWNILNYGRTLYGVRREEALFMQLVLAYQNTVLVANQEVENALTSYSYSWQTHQKLRESADASAEAIRVLNVQLSTGLIDFNRISLLLQNLVQQRDQEAVALGNVAQALIQVYRTLGDGWELRLTGCDPQTGGCAAPARLGVPTEEVAPAPRGHTGLPLSGIFPRSQARVNDAPQPAAPAAPAPTQATAAR